MDQILNQILNELKLLKDGQQSLKEEVSELKEGQLRIEKKLDSFYKVTAGIAECKSEKNIDLENISTIVDFLRYKARQTDEDLYALKRNFHLINK